MRTLDDVIRDLTEAYWRLDNARLDRLPLDIRQYRILAAALEAEIDLNV